MGNLAQGLGVAQGLAVAPPECERELLARLRAGQADAFAQLMRRYNRRLFRAARGIVADDAEAQDAVQEGYLRAFLALDGYRGEASLGTWLTRIVIHQALGQQRRLGRVVFLDESLSLHEESAMGVDERTRRRRPGATSCASNWRRPSTCCPRSTAACSSCAPSRD